MLARTRRRLTKTVLVIGACTVALAACTSSGKQGSSTSPSGAASLTTVKFATTWVTPDFEDIPVLVAQQNGYYAAAGLKVDVSYPPTTTSSPKLLATGTVNLAYVNSSDLVAAVKQHVPLQAIAGVWQRPSNALVAKPGATIEPGTFRGKSFAIFAGAENVANLNLFLKAAGLTTSDVKVITASSDNLALVLAGKVDYALNASPYAEAEIKSATGKNPSLLLASGLPLKSTYAQTVYAGETSWMSSHQTVVRKWLAATLRGAHWAIANPAKAVAMFQAKLGKASGGNSVYNTAGWNAAIPLINANHRLFYMDNAQWSNLETFLHDGGAVTGAMPAISTLYTNKYLSAG